MVIVFYLLAKTEKVQTEFCLRHCIVLYPISKALCATATKYIRKVTFFGGVVVGVTVTVKNNCPCSMTSTDYLTVIQQRTSSVVTL